MTRPPGDAGTAGIPPGAWMQVPCRLSRGGCRCGRNSYTSEEVAAVEAAAARNGTTSGGADGPGTPAGPQRLLHPQGPLAGGPAAPARRLPQLPLRPPGDGVLR